MKVKCNIQYILYVAYNTVFIYEWISRATVLFIAQPFQSFFICTTITLVPWPVLKNPRPNKLVTNINMLDRKISKVSCRKGIGQVNESLKKNQETYLISPRLVFRLISFQANSFERTMGSHNHKKEGSPSLHHQFIINVPPDFHKGLLPWVTQKTLRRKWPVFQG